MQADFLSQRFFLRAMLLLSVFLSFGGCKANMQGQADQGHGPESEEGRSHYQGQSSGKKTVGVKFSVETRLLIQAQKAFRLGRYTTPQHDNAYDKFHSVLLINPTSSRARSGLQAILLRYAELVRSALQNGRLGAASAYLSQAELFYPANALLMDLKKDLRLANKRQPAEVFVAKGSSSEHEEFNLPLDELSDKSSVVTQILSNIALRVKETDESILIFARNDKEGRWIYKQLKQSASGYRVRGDIRISKAPKIRILPPL